VKHLPVAPVKLGLDFKLPGLGCIYRPAQCLNLAFSGTRQLFCSLSYGPNRAIFRGSLQESEKRDTYYLNFVPVFLRQAQDDRI
jgi:hypothetical protein